MTLARVSTADLRKLRDLASSRALSCPLTDASLRAHGFAGVVDELLAALPFDQRGSLVAALDLVVDERMRAQRPPIELVWSGPDVAAPQCRDTAVVLQEVFERATREVLVAGYWFTQRHILEPLHRSMLRGVRARMFVHLEAGVSRAEDGPAYAAACIRQFTHKVWVFGPPYPDFYYDPRTVLRGTGDTLLHAKCTVADRRLALVTSANFTAAGQTRNIEVGALIDDPLFASRLEGQFNALVAEGRLANVVWR